jgi:hypothetical protein
MRKTMNYPDRETIAYKGFDINVIYDEAPSNPFEDWEGEPPLIVSGDRYLTSYGIDLSPPELSREDIKENGKLLAELFDCRSLLHFFTEYVPYNKSNYSDMVYAVNEGIEEYFNSDLYDSKKLDMLEALYRLKRYPVLQETRTGYSQGDWVTCLVIATPEWIKEMGAPDIKDDEYWQKSLSASIDLYAAWAFGDVFGYSVDEIDESCWGYYGTDLKENGLLESAENAIDWHVSHIAKMRSKKLKLITGS